MNTKSFSVILMISGMLALCTQVNAQSKDMIEAIQNAETSTDHIQLAKHYEDQAKEMQTMVEEHKKRLQKYRDYRSHYGKLAKNLQEHCKRLISNYEQAAAENLSMADAHRQMAQELSK